MERAAHIDGRGWYLTIRTTSSKEAVQVRTSETGRTLQTWKTSSTENVIKVPDEAR